MDLKNFDWRSLQKYLDPKASGDLNAFLEKYNMDVKNITDESELRYLAALQVRELYALCTVRNNIDKRRFSLSADKRTRIS